MLVKSLRWRNLTVPYMEFIFQCRGNASSRGIVECLHSRNVPRWHPVDDILLGQRVDCRINLVVHALQCFIEIVAAGFVFFPRYENKLFEVWQTPVNNAQYVHGNARSCHRAVRIVNPEDGVADGDAAHGGQFRRVAHGHASAKLCFGVHVALSGPEIEDVAAWVEVNVARPMRKTKAAVVALDSLGA